MIYIHKGYQIKPHKETPTSYIIVTDGKGGKIPDCLSGLFTSTGIARKEIDSYVEIKEVKDAKKLDKS